MSTDLNWLYSTIAQSSAAIVAIIGGFITHSVLMLAAEKRSLKNQRTDKEIRLEALREEEERLLEESEALKVREFLNYVIDELTVADEWPSFEVMMETHPQTQNLNRGKLKCKYEKLSKQTLDSMHFIEQHSNKIEVLDALTFDEWVAKNNLDISGYDKDVLEREYDRKCERQQKVLSEKERLVLETRRPKSIKLPTLTLTLWEQQELERIRDRLSNLEHEILLFESDLATLDTRLGTFSYPPNLGKGLITLAFLAAFGVLSPILIIADEASSHPWAKIYTMVTFLPSILGVFLYITYQIIELGRK